MNYVLTIPHYFLNCISEISVVSVAWLIFTSNVSIATDIHLNWNQKLNSLELYL